MINRRQIQHKKLIKIELYVNLEFVKPGSIIMILHTIYLTFLKIVSKSPTTSLFRIVFSTKI